MDETAAPPHTSRRSMGKANKRRAPSSKDDDSKVSAPPPQARKPHTQWIVGACIVVIVGTTLWRRHESRADRGAERALTLARQGQHAQAVVLLKQELADHDDLAL